MSTNELAFPISATAVPLPIATDTVGLTFAMPDAVRNDVSVSAVIFSPSGNFGRYGIGVVLRGLAVITAGGVAGTVTMKCFRNGTTQVDPNMSQPITLAANEVKVIPFEFTDGFNPTFGAQWFYTITLNPSGAAATLNKAYGHSWAA